LGSATCSSFRKLDGQNLKSRKTVRNTKKINPVVLILHTPQGNGCGNQCCLSGKSAHNRVRRVHREHHFSTEVLFS
jgi:hypothetical protein